MHALPEAQRPAADALVVFGITGDLARRMTLRSLYGLEAAGRLACPVIGVAREDWSDDRLRVAAREALRAADTPVDGAVFSRFAGRLSYVQGDFTDEATYAALARALASKRRPVFYLAVPPSLFGPVVRGLGRAGLTNDALVAVEKPFGHDLASARVLDSELHAILAEEQVLRLDHFLGKQPVLDIHFLRFANTLLEPVWSRDHVAAIQVSMAEDFGVEDRGAFYDAVGALRDVVQNHLLQVLALILMEPPVGTRGDALRNKTVDVFRAMPDADPSRCLRGQYAGYREIAGVRPDSETETYVALQLAVENWRWAGVPIFIRAGKAMAKRVTEVRVIFRRPPPVGLVDTPGRVAANEVVLRIDPDPGMRVGLLSKGVDGKASRPVHLDASFAQELGKPVQPYERLLNDALQGDRSLFVRQDSVEETWRILQPLLEAPAQVRPYARGSWGPAGADELVRGYPAWQTPWLPSGGAGGR